MIRKWVIKLLLDSNSKELFQLLIYFDDLSNIDKIKLAISLIEDSGFNLEIEKVILYYLKKVLSMLDDNYNKSLTNLTRNKILIFFLAKYMEFSKEDKKHFLIEVLFNIYSTNFGNIGINEVINNNLNVYEYYYKI